MTRPESTTATGVTNDSAVWGAYALRLFVLFAAPLVVATVVYGPYLGEYFALDDWIWLRESSDGSLWTVVVRAFTFPDADDFSGPTPFFRPLADIAFKVQYDAFGMRPEAFHVLNLSVHALVCGLSGWFVVRLTGRYWTGLAAATLFAAAPTYEVAVLWISSISELLGAMFGVLVLHAALSFLADDSKSRARLWLFGGSVCLAMALMSKQSAAVVVVLAPLLLLVVDDVKRTRIELCSAGAIIAAVVAVYAVLVVADPGSEVAEYGLTRQTERYVDYVGRLVWPFGDGWTRTLAIVGYAILGGWLLVARQRAGAFFFAWSLLALVAFTAVPGPPQWRYTYGATFAFFACLCVAGDAVVTLSAPIGWRRLVPVAGLAIAGVITVAWIPATRENFTWHNRQAANDKRVEAAVRAQCGSLPQGAAVYLLPGAAAFDPFGTTNRDLVNTIYDRVYVRFGEPEGRPAGQPVCIVRRDNRGSEE